MFPRHWTGIPDDPPPPAVIVRGLPDDPVGQKEIAQRLGVPEGTVQQWRTRGVLPEPAWPSVGGRPAWAWTAVEQWARETGRLRSDTGGASPA